MALSWRLSTRLQRRFWAFFWPAFLAGLLLLVLLYPRSSWQLLPWFLAILSASALVETGARIGRSQRGHVRQRVPVWVRRSHDGTPDVLVVDDDPSVLSVVKDVLESAGYRVTSAAGGPEALGRLNQQRYDLVLCDLVMPVMSGFELGRVLSTWDGRPPIVALTAWPVPEGGALAAGYDALLRKPFEVADLVGLADALTGRRQSAGAVA